MLYEVITRPALTRIQMPPCLLSRMVVNRPGRLTFRTTPRSAFGGLNPHIDAVRIHVQSDLANSPCLPQTQQSHVQFGVSYNFV